MVNHRKSAARHGLEIVDAEEDRGPGFAAFSEVLRHGLSGRRKVQYFRGFGISCQTAIGEDFLCRNMNLRPDQRVVCGPESERAEVLPAAFGKGVISAHEERNISANFQRDVAESLAVQLRSPNTVQCKQRRRRIGRAAAEASASRDSRSRRAARSGKSSAASPTRSPERCRSPSARSSTSTQSARSISAKALCSSWWPSARRPSTCRKRFSLAGAGRARARQTERSTGIWGCSAGCSGSGSGRRSSWSCLRSIC